MLARAYINRAFVLGELGRVEEALADDDTAIALKPPDILVLASAYANRAVHLRDLGDSPKSQASWNIACALGFPGCESEPAETTGS